MRVTIRKKRWELVFRNLDKDERWAYCEAPHEKGKEIVIDSGLHGAHRLSCLVHEILHSACWDLDEDAVQSAADDLAKILWRLGYRGPDDDED